jgi:hypothetical protein
MAVLNDDQDHPVIGVVMFAEGSWNQGYYWMPGMNAAQFVDHPKTLPNDVVWVTNLPYEKTKGKGRYFKHSSFLRLPMDVLLKEISPFSNQLGEQALHLGKILQRLSDCPESDSLREAGSLTAALGSHFNLAPTVHPDWGSLPDEALSRFWQGSQKNKLLLGGSLFVPRYPYALQLLQVPVPDFSLPPIRLKATESGDTLRNILMNNHGFVRLRVENVQKSIQDFISLDRTLWTTHEALWLMDRAQVTSKSFYVVKSTVKHPAYEKIGREKLVQMFQPYSWLDGLRALSLYMSPASPPLPAWEAWLRASAHLAMAFHAEYLVRRHGVICLSLSMGKIGVAYSSRERGRVAQLSRESGLIPILTDDTLQMGNPYVDNRTNKR